MDKKTEAMDSISDMLSDFGNAMQNTLLKKYPEIVEKLKDNSDMEKIGMIEELRYKITDADDLSAMIRYIRSQINVPYDKGLFYIYSQYQELIMTWLENYFRRLNRTHVSCVDYARTMCRVLMISTYTWNPKAKNCFWIPPIGTKKLLSNLLKYKLLSLTNIVSWNLIWCHVQLVFLSIFYHIWQWILRPYRQYKYKQYRLKIWNAYIKAYNTKHDKNIAPNMIKMVRFQDHHIYNLVFGTDIKRRDFYKIIGDMIGEDVFKEINDNIKYY